MKKALVLFVMAIGLVGCAQAPSGMGHAIFYQDTIAPVAVTQETIVNKVGRACATNTLGFVAKGDMSIEAAKKAGGITKVVSIDQSYNSVLGFFVEKCTIVRGS